MTTERRLFASSLPAVGSESPLDEEAVAHARVLRLADGDALVLFDGQGRLADATVVRFDGKRLHVRGTSVRTVPPEVPRLTLLLALTRAGKLDDIVRAATELGVAKIVLARASRSAGVSARSDRLEVVAREATRQSERAYVPRLVGPLAFEDAVREASDVDRRVVACGRTGGPLGVAPATSASLAVGPEGGFTDAELDCFDALGFARASLGPHVLRVETAATAGLAVVRAACVPLS